MAVDEPGFELPAVNDLVDVENLAYLLRFDTVYGRYPKPVAIEARDLAVAGRKVRTLQAGASGSTQSIVDGPSKRFRGGRAAAANLVPATTGAARATTRALPQYAGLFDGNRGASPHPRRLDRGHHVRHVEGNIRGGGEPDLH